MRANHWFCAVGVVLSWSGTVIAQDPAKVNPEMYKQILDNPTVRVLRVTGGPGAGAAVHAHPDHLAIALSAAKVRIVPKGGAPDARDMAAGTALYVPAGAHESSNAGSAPLDIILVELKAEAGTGTIPTSRDNMNIKVLADGPKAVVYRSTAAPSFQEPAGTTHDYAQVVIAIEPTSMSLSVDGQPAKTSWARGDVAFIGRGVKHEAKNTTGKPVDFIIVAIR